MFSYHLIVFGCQMNVSDAEKMTAALNKIGLKSVDNKQADLIIIVCCSVRQRAMDRVYGRVRKYKRLGKKVILTGCILPADKKKMESMADAIISIEQITDLAKIIKRILPVKMAATGGRLPKDYLELKSQRLDSKTAYVPIMTGCNNFCSYCAVPYTRGRERSRSAVKIYQEASQLVKSGYQEIMLLGQNVNSYKGQSVSIKDFADLLQSLDNIKGDFTLKFLSSHPKDVSDKLIKVMAKSKHIAQEIHLPVQAGDNKILRAMNRGYTVGQYKRLVAKIRKAMPDIKISTDVIVGFPGETKKQFSSTVKLFKQLKFNKAYISQYSSRPGTRAALLKDNVSSLEKKRREKALERLVFSI